MQKATKRLPQYHQVGASELPRFDLTDRELAILAMIGEHRIADSDQIASLLAHRWSEATTRRRLRLLHHARFIRRVPSQIKYRKNPGSPPMAYQLDVRTVELRQYPERFGVPLELVEDIPPGPYKWVSKSPNVGADFLEHALFTTDIMATLELSCRARGTVRLIKPREIIETIIPAATRTRPKPFKWMVTVRWQGRNLRIGVEPDRVFGLEFVNEPPPNRVWFFLETDTGEETVLPESQDLKPSSFLQKAACYFETWRQGVHSEHFGFKNFRVLTVTATPSLLLPQTKKELRKRGAVDAKTRSKIERRIGLLLEANRKATEGRGSNLFLFTDLPSLLVADDILAMPWTSGTGKSVRLTD
ncbi:MAG: replication-relaxation family protein [Rhodospirillales bacterium]